MESKQFPPIVRRIKRQTHLDMQGIPHPMSRVRRYIDNIPPEGFWGCLKRRDVASVVSNTDGDSNSSFSTITSVSRLVSTAELRWKEERTHSMPKLWSSTRFRQTNGYRNTGPFLHDEPQENNYHTPKNMVVGLNKFFSYFACFGQPAFTTEVTCGFAPLYQYRKPSTSILSPIFRPSTAL